MNEMLPFFKELFEFSHHCNQKLIVIFEENPTKISKKSLELINHILNAHQIWNNRIDHQQKLHGVWELHKVQDLKIIDKANYNLTLQILDKFDLKDTTDYSNSKGQNYSSSVRDILFHIINHSTYHRGQVATEFKNQGIEPLITDYIFFKR